MHTTARTAPMAGKVCLVTGATSGIGRMTALSLAAQGANLVFTGRQERKAEETLRWIQAETGSKNVQYLLADFADLQQVRQLIQTFKSRFDRLDVLVNNAGAFFNTRHETSFGVEETFLVNHLAPFLLTCRLLNVMLASQPARIINVSSGAHYQGEIDFDDLGFRRGYSGMRAYARSKLANVLFTYQLARRLEDLEVTVNAVHPGHVATDIWRSSFPGVGRAVKWFLGFIALTPEAGADNSVYLATSPEVEGISGRYFVKREAVPSSPSSYDEGLAQQLWEVSQHLTARQAAAGASR